MEWLVLVTWLIVAGLGLAVGPAVLISPALGLQAMLCGAGLALVVVFMALGDDPSALAWITVGVGAVAAVVLTAGVATLTSADRSEGGLPAAGEELAALFTGVQLPFLLVAVALSVAMALGIGTVI